jgi:AraC-like DNA-binding protein
MCGFSAASYFIRVFRQQTGLTPRAWRESARVQ